MATADVNMGDVVGDEEAMERRILDAQSNYYAAMAPVPPRASAEDQARQAKLASIERSVQGARQLARTAPEYQRTFTSFVAAASVAAADINAKGIATEDWPPVLQMVNVQNQMYLSTTGRSRTLSRANGATLAAESLAAEAAANLEEAAINAIPRASPSAAPVGVADGASEAIDLRLAGIGAWSASAAEYHRVKAAHQFQARPNGTGRSPLDPYECSMDHVAWCLTARHGPFRPCLFGDRCAGKTLKGISDAYRVTLKAYVSPEVRAHYERTGKLKDTDEHNRPLLDYCIIDYLAIVQCIASTNVANQETSGILFPDFYNPSGRPGTYAPSALNGFSTIKLNGIVRAFRLFKSDQLMPARVRLTVPRYNERTREIEKHEDEVPGFVERTNIVAWRPGSETDPQREVWLHEAPPFTAPAARPPHAPVASEALPAVSAFAPMPRTLYDAATREREARAPFAHMLPPREAAPSNITFSHVARNDRPAPPPPPPPAAAKQADASKKRAPPAPASATKQPVAKQPKKADTPIPKTGDALGFVDAMIKRLEDYREKLKSATNAQHAINQQETHQPKN